VGEAWELVDRPEAQSVVHEGPLKGFTLHELWTDRREEIFGKGLPDADRFPLLFKILDAQERLSLQVHPPADVAFRRGGEPKTEMWYVLDATLESDLYVGMKAGATRDSFEQALREGHVADQVHTMPVAKGDWIFIPSGRVHAIGAGNVIVEVQQNSDTTYRVFDWNRLGTDGRPRDLHIAESLECINFDDVEPRKDGGDHEELLEKCEFFQVERWALSGPRKPATEERFAVFTVVEGKVRCGKREFGPGSFFLIPPCGSELELVPIEANAVVLRSTIPV
jgi:mannose-6-phosphate isomerase